MNLGQIIVTPVFPEGVILLLFIMGFAAAAVQYGLIKSRLGRLRALELSLLRLCAILLLVSLCLNPSVVRREERHVSPSIAVLVDTSPSMGLPGRGGKGSRLEDAKALLEGEGSLLNSLPKEIEVRLYGMDETLKPFKAEDLGNLRPGQKKGDLGEALRNLSGKNVLAVLLSDGDMTWDAGTPGAPTVLSVPVGDPGNYKDVFIKAVKAPAMAFRGREAVIDVTVKGYRYAGSTLPLLLKEGNKLLTAKSVQLESSPGEKTLSLPFLSEEAGQHNLSISVPNQFGESVLANNTVNLSIKIVRDKIRILMVSGNPSLSYRFMRAAFKNDPSIDLLSFVILRTPSDIINVPVQEQSLIPFPVETLFTKELTTFDLLIFDNFPTHLYLSSLYFENIRDFVRSGGSFAMIGGSSLLDGGRYAGTPIGEILPVGVTGKEEYRRDSPSEVKLTRAGISHPMTRFSSDQDRGKGDPQGFWEEMPALEGINLLSPKSSATVLLEGARGDRAPILTVGSFGKGRVLVLATDDSWKWYMGMVGKGKGNWAYFRLMERMARWLTKDPSLEPVEIILPERPRLIGQETEIRMKVREVEDSTLREDFSSQKGAVSLSVFNPDGGKTEAQLKKTGPSGEYLASFFPEKSGAYKVRIETPSSFLEETVMVAGFLEDLDGAPSVDRLRMASASTGGKLLSRTDDLINEIETYGKRDEKTFVEERRIPLWGTLYILILLVALLSTEWYLRRRWGLV